MQTTTQVWKDLFAAGAAVEARAVIGGTVYTDISAPVIARAAMQDSLSVGNAAAASLSLVIRGAGNIPRSAAVAVEARLNDGTTASEWLPQGTFYISRRARDPVSGLLALECYDALLKANGVWTPSQGSWPRDMAAVAGELAALLGLQIDSRSNVPTGTPYVIAEPAAGITIREALGAIAQAGGGNWIVTPRNALRLLALDEEGDALEVAGIVGGLDAGAAGAVTGVRSTVDGVVALVGDDTGIVVDMTIAPMIAAQTAPRLIGLSYQPFRLTGAIYDPAAELGDRVLAGANGEVDSALYSAQFALGPAFRGDIAAPQAGEVTDEYPYIGSGVRVLTLAKAAAREAVDALDSCLTQQEIFDRLTDNGAAQGMVLYNGQLYVNASYIRTGTLSADLLKGGTLTLGGEDNVNGTMRVMDQLGNQYGVLNNNGLALTSTPAARTVLTVTRTSSQGSEVVTLGGRSVPLAIDVNIAGPLYEKHYTVGMSGIEMNNGAGESARLNIDRLVLTGGVYHSTPGIDLVDSGSNTRASLSPDGGLVFYRNNASRTYIQEDSAYFYGAVNVRDAATTRTNLNVPSRSGDGASGTWDIDISGNADSISGVVELNHGGTGEALTQNPSMLVDLGDTAADDVFQNAPRPGVTGVLPVDHGGTGEALTRNPSMLVDLGDTAADDVFQNAPRPGVTGVLPVNHGGTGEATAAAARANLGAAALASPNNLMHSGNEFTFASDGFSGNIYINFRTAGGLNGNITRYTFCDGGGNALAYITSNTFSGNAANVTGTVGIDHGGTGATTAAAARANLGVNDIGPLEAQSTLSNLNHQDQLTTITVSVDCWVCASFHVTANSDGKCILLRNGYPVINNAGTNGACNYWANAQFPVKAGGLLQYRLNSNATDSSIRFLTV